MLDEMSLTNCRLLRRDGPVLPGVGGSPSADRLFARIRRTQGRAERGRIDAGVLEIFDAAG